MRVAIVSNGNALSTVECLPLIHYRKIDVVGLVLMQVPPGRGGALRRLGRLARRTGVRYAGYKALSIAIPRVAGLLSRQPLSLEQLCKRRGARVLRVSSVNAPGVVSFLRGARPDVILSISCPQVIDPRLLQIASLAAVNVHQSLLPSYAGIAPYFWVLRNGEPRAGVTVHLMVDRVDAGPILRQAAVEPLPGDSALGLQLRLAQVAGRELLLALDGLPSSTQQASAQDLSEASFFGWPTSDDVRALHRRGHRLARRRDFVALLDVLRGGSERPAVALPARHLGAGVRRAD